VIGFVDHRDLDRVEADHVLLHQVFEPAGAGHDNVDARLQRRHLLALRHPTEDRGHPEVVGGGQRFQRRGDLAGQLPGGGKNQTRWSGRVARMSGQPADHRNGEGERLAAACLAAAKDVSAGECVGKSFDLDGKRLGDPACGEHFDEWFIHAEIGKCLANSHSDVFQHRLCRVGGEIRAVGQHKVARLLVGKIDRRDTNYAGFSASATRSGRAPEG
jgi:hypothetical protein